MQTRSKFIITLFFSTIALSVVGVAQGGLGAAQEALPQVLQVAPANNIWICDATSNGFKVLPVNNGTDCIDGTECMLTVAVYLHRGTPAKIIDSIEGTIFPNTGEARRIPSPPPYLWEKNLTEGSLTDPELFIPPNSVNCMGRMYKTSVVLQNNNGVPWGTLTFAGEIKFSTAGKNPPRDANGKEIKWGLITGSLNDYQDFNFTPPAITTRSSSLVEDKAIAMPGVSIVESTKTGSTIRSEKMTIPVNVALIAREGQLIAPVGRVEKQIVVMPNDLNEITNSDTKQATLEVTREKAVYTTEGQQNVKLLGIIPVEMKVKTIINAETAKLEKIEKPFWSIFTIR